MATPEDGVIVSSRSHGPLPVRLILLISISSCVINLAGWDQAQAFQHYVCLPLALRETQLVLGVDFCPFPVNGCLK